MERPMKHTGIALVCAIRSEQQRRLARHRASRPRLTCWPSRRRPAGDSSILGDNPGCHLLSASDVKNAVGKDRPSLLGNVSNGQAGNTGHESCTYTADETGKGAAVNLEINTFPGVCQATAQHFPLGTAGSGRLGEPDPSGLRDPQGRQRRRWRLRGRPPRERGRRRGRVVHQGRQGGQRRS